MYRPIVLGLSRRVGFLVVAGVLVAGLAACSESVAGSGSLAAEAIVPPTPSTARPAATPTAARTPTPAATPTPTQRRRDPAKVARAVEIRAGDLPGDWRLVPGSRTGSDSLDWLVACARDAGVSPGTLSGAQTPDFAPNGSNRFSQVGTATGLFPDDAAARRFVALVRQGALAACVSSEAGRAWPDAFRTGPAFRPVYPLPRGADEAAGISGAATLTDRRRATYQFLAVRTGPIVTMINTGWIGSPQASVTDRVIARVAARQRTA